MSKKKNKKYKEVRNMNNEINNENGTITEIKSIETPINYVSGLSVHANDVSIIEENTSNIEENVSEPETEESVITDNGHNDPIGNEGENAIEESEETNLILGVINCNNLLNVRKEPSKESEVIGIVSNGDNVNVIEEINGFYKITTPSGINGFCVKEFVRID